MTKYDVAIIGGGILGTTISYWISNLYDIKTCVIEKESDVAMHASSRNTAVIHSPFYLDPQKKKILAKSSIISYDMWKELAKERNLPWKNVGKLMVAIKEGQTKTLEKYMVWGVENGIPEKDIELLDGNEVSKREPNLHCFAAINSKRDTSADYGSFTKEIKRESEQNGTNFLLYHKVNSIKIAKSDVTITFDDNTSITSNLIINCAGGNSLSIAKKFGLVKEYSDLNFRGEYWVADSDYADLVKTNVYSVAEFQGYPFLDPHWIKRANGQSEVGPNATLVPTPETYSGYLGDLSDSISKMAEIVTGNAKKLFFKPEFLSLISKEWLSSISKTVMIERVKKFIPNIRSSYFSKRGTAGIRTPIITPQGNFLSDVMELEGPHSYHILNYNSPGATGIPAYSAFLVKKLQEKGLLDYPVKTKPSIWNFEKVIDQT